MFFDEDSIVVLKNELKEEPAVGIAVGDSFASFTYTNELKGSNSVGVIYFTQFVSPLDAVTLNQEGHPRFWWFTEDELDLVMVEDKMENNPEIVALKKAFDLLDGGVMNFG